MKKIVTHVIEKILTEVVKILLAALLIQICWNILIEGVFIQYNIPPLDYVAAVAMMLLINMITYLIKD